MAFLRVFKARGPVGEVGVELIWDIDGRIHESGVGFIWAKSSVNKWQFTLFPVHGAWTAYGDVRMTV